MQVATNRERKGTGRSEEPSWCAGHAVLDPEGRKIRVAKEVFTNGRVELEYVRVGMGLFALRKVSSSTRTGRRSGSATRPRDRAGVQP